ncbi:MAG: competence/damage-inducible protein A [Cytophagales bacterium]|nr:competence/damage-inducible protein A [Cytophagales bacterium]
MIHAEVIAIGDELLYGHTPNTNSQWMSAALTNLGVKVIQATTVRDEEAAILKAFEDAEQRATIILITGGLGPTKDDLTKPLLAHYFNSPMVLHAQALADIKGLLKSKGKALTPTNKAQAILPEKCTIIRNELGTAPGMWFEKNEKVFIAMPGVPHEMQKMMLATVLPKLKNTFELPSIYHKIIKTVGMGESGLVDKLQPWEEQLPPTMQLAYLPGIGEVSLRLTAIGSQLEKLQEEVEAQVQQLTLVAQQYIYGYDEDTLEGVVGSLLKAQKKTIAIAESCSGGYISHRITRIPGSSIYYQGGIIPYQNEMKINLLAVSTEALHTNGAVSEEVVIEMAQKVRKKFKTDIGLANSGIAGPSGGSYKKPVGTVWIALTDGKVTYTKKLQLGNDRLTNIQLTAIALLNLLRQTLLTHTTQQGCSSV